MIVLYIIFGILAIVGLYILYLYWDLMRRLD